MKQHVQYRIHYYAYSAASRPHKRVDRRFPMGATGNECTLHQVAFLPGSPKDQPAPDSGLRVPARTSCFKNF